MNLAAAFALLLGLVGADPGTPDFVSVHPKARTADWSFREAEINAELANPARLKATRLLFVGDSITELWLRGGDPTAPGQTYGRAIWNESFATPGSANYALNLGVASDRTEHLLFRILPKAQGGLGELDPPQLNPDVIVLMIGINNAWAANRVVADSVYEGVRTVLAALHERKPKAQIVLQSLLPIFDEGRNRIVVQSVNQRLQGLAKTPPHAGYVHYLNLYPAFVDKKGRQNPGLFNDAVHPNEAGYRVWRERLVPFLAEVRRKKS